MKKHTNIAPFIAVAIGISSFFNSCTKDPIAKHAIPATYAFTKNDVSTVNYAGQTDRLKQLDEMVSLVETASEGTKISGQAMKDMFANTGGNGGGNFSFTSSRQLKDKAFFLDTDWFNTFFDQLAAASDSAAINVQAKNGCAGLLTRSSNAKILLNANGLEFKEGMEKSVMFSVFLYKIMNDYLSESKLGDAVDNTTAIDNANYTSLEHHADEAFGYLGAPIDFKSNYTGATAPLFWAEYLGDFDAALGCADKVMLAFKTMRTAIVNKDNTVKNEQRKVIAKEMEIMVAAAAIHYVNESLKDVNQGDRLHHLSELWGFVKALGYFDPTQRSTTSTELENLLTNELGTNLWNVTEQGMNDIKNFLASRYNLEAMKSSL